MAPRYYVMNIDGKFQDGKFFTKIPMKGQVFHIFNQWYEITEVKNSIDIIYVERI